jgi:hypothetical protein
MTPEKPTLPAEVDARLAVAALMVAALAPTWRTNRISESPAECRYRLIRCGIEIADELLREIARPPLPPSPF